MAGIMDEERGHERRGALSWGGGRHGAVLRRGVVLRRGAVLRHGVVHGRRRRRREARGGGRVRGERWCPSARGGAPAARGEGLARG